jgi:uncharacterized protein with ParB-like and HNH nuclease domain
MKRVKATEVSILEFLKQPMQMVVFEPQRRYRWTEEQCQQLWNDIVQVAKNEAVPGHSIGTIVYAEFSRHPVPKLVLIDGQQRLVTVSLIIAALAKTNDKTEGQISLKRKTISDLLLFNSQEKGEYYYKLTIAERDQDTFINLITGKELPSYRARRLIKNYQYFENKINESGLDIGLLYQGIAKLTIMNISTDDRYENPELVYERINSTGLDTIQTALIRNWLGLLRSTS